MENHDDGKRGFAPPFPDHAEVELELRMHMTNLCLAVVSKEPGMIRECKDLLVQKVCELITAATPTPKR